jgi:hypothetical protein
MLTKVNNKCRSSLGISNIRKKKRKASKNKNAHGWLWSNGAESFIINTNQVCKKVNNFRESIDTTRLVISMLKRSIVTRVKPKSGL